MSKMWDIWVEGYSVTCQQEPARFVGTEQADTFREACQKHYRRKEVQEKAAYQAYDPERNTYWGCNLFDNEADARRAYG